MKRTILLAAVAFLALSIPSLADTNVGGGCTGNCSGNGSGGDPAPVTVTNTNTNQNVNTNTATGGAASSSASSNSTSGASAVTGPSTSSASTGAVTNHNNSSATGGAGGSATGGNATGGSSGASASITQDRSAATAFAAPLAATESCQRSTSGGVQTLGFGFSLGSTYSDPQCERRNDATLLQNVLGKHDAAVAIMCLDAEVKTAIHATGDKCPGE